MAKINKYWGFVAVGALTAAAAGAIAAAFLKNRTDLEDFDFDDEDFDQDESEEKPAKESKEAFQSWEPSPNDETENDVTAASQEDTATPNRKQRMKLIRLLMLHRKMQLMKLQPKFLWNK